MSCEFSVIPLKGEVVVGFSRTFAHPFVLPPCNQYVRFPLSRSLLSGHYCLIENCNQETGRPSAHAGRKARFSLWRSVAGSMKVQKRHA